MNPEDLKNEKLLATFSPRAQEFLRNAQRQAEADRKFVADLLSPEYVKDEAAFQRFLEACNLK